MVTAKRSASAAYTIIAPTATSDGPSGALPPISSRKSTAIPPIGTTATA
jgi:hypothetical protein